MIGYKKNLMHRHVLQLERIGGVRTRTPCLSLRSYPSTLVSVVFAPDHTVLRGCLRAFVLEHDVQKKKKHRLFGLEDTYGRVTTRASLCQSRPLSSLHVERIFDQLQAAFFWTR